MTYIVSGETSNPTHTHSLLTSLRPLRYIGDMSSDDFLNDMAYQNKIIRTAIKMCCGMLVYAYSSVDILFS